MKSDPSQTPIRHAISARNASECTDMMTNALCAKHVSKLECPLVTGAETRKYHPCTVESAWRCTRSKSIEILWQSINELFDDSIYNACQAFQQNVLNRAIDTL